MKIKRIYFIVPNADLARTIVNELLVARVEENRILIMTQRRAAELEGTEPRIPAFP